MPVHKLILGDPKYLPFALSKLRGLEGQGDGAWNWFADDGTRITIRISGDEQYVRIEGAPNLITGFFTAAGEWHSLLVNSDSAYVVEQRRVAVSGSTLTPATTSMRDYKHVGDGYFLRWSNVFFTPPTGYYGSASDLYIPVLESIKNPESYSQFDPLALQKGNGMIYNSAPFTIGQDGIRRNADQALSLSLTPFGQLNTQGEHAFAVMANQPSGTTPDLNVPYVNPPAMGIKYTPQMFTATTRNKLPSAVTLPLPTGRRTRNSRLFPIGRGKAIMVVGYPLQAIDYSVPTYEADLPIQFYLTQDFGHTWTVSNAPVLAHYPGDYTLTTSLYPPTPPITPVNTVIVCGPPPAVGSGLRATELGWLDCSFFVPMSKDGMKVLWVLPNVAISTGSSGTTGTYTRGTAIFRSTDGGLTFSFVESLPVELAWIELGVTNTYQVFGEGCVQFMAYPEPTGNIVRYVTYDYGTTWTTYGAGTSSAVDVLCVKPYVSAAQPGKLYTAYQHANTPPEMGMRAFDGLFNTDASTVFKQQVLRSGTNVALLPSSDPTFGIAIEFIGKPGDKDVILPALPGLMRI